jgi:hypothetical protein
VINSFDFWKETTAAFVSEQAHSIATRNFTRQFQNPKPLSKNGFADYMVRLVGLCR